MYLLEERIHWFFVILDNILEIIITSDVSDNAKITEAATGGVL